MLHPPWYCWVWPPRRDPEGVDCCRGPAMAARVRRPAPPSASSPPCSGSQWGRSRGGGEFPRGRGRPHPPHRRGGGSRPPKRSSCPWLLRSAPVTKYLCLARWDVEFCLSERSLEAALLTSRPHAELSDPSGGFVYIVSESKIVWWKQWMNNYTRRVPSN